jgi:hypothetical protein
MYSTREVETEWACAACTFINTDMDAEACEVCFTPRPLPPPPTNTTQSTMTSSTMMHPTNDTNSTENSTQSNEDDKDAPIGKNSSVEQITKVLEVLRHFHGICWLVE